MSRFHCHKSFHGTELRRTQQLLHRTPSVTPVFGKASRKIVNGNREPLQKLQTWRKAVVTGCKKRKTTTIYNGTSNSSKQNEEWWNRCDNRCPAFSSTEFDSYRKQQQLTTDNKQPTTSAQHTNTHMVGTIENTVKVGKRETLNTQHTCNLPAQLDCPASAAPS